MRRLPEKFCNRMRCLLGDEADAFFDALEIRPAVRGVRLNPIKAEKDALIAAFPGKLIPLPYAKDGFYTEEDLPGLGNLPFHHAGMAYLQDPGAMAAIEAVELKEGMKAADLCAAPGGKSAQIAAKIGKEGFLLSNEYVPKRAKLLVGNLERLGVQNALVSSLDTGTLTGLFRNYFDFVLADAPCSGEGMFRKSEEALAAWSEENVRTCAAQQKEILNNAAELVRPGGKLMYATCTWSPEEDEEVVDDFLAGHPAFRLCAVKPAVAAITADGIAFAGAKFPEEIKKCRRFYPHLSPGEGQFIALFEREKSNELPTILYKSGEKPLTKEENAIIQRFLSETMEDEISGRIVRAGDRIVVSPKIPLLPRSLFMAGVLLGEIRGKNLFPEHQFFSAYGRQMRIRIELSDDDALRYLRGEEIAVNDGHSGFCAVLYRGAPLGGGKISQGKLKNHYPKGLRLPPA